MLRCIVIDSAVEHLFTSIPSDLIDVDLASPRLSSKNASASDSPAGSISLVIVSLREAMDDGAKPRQVNEFFPQPQLHLP
jgi:hypothetical protein